MLIDIVFSLDSIITAVGMVEQVSVMMAAVVASVGLMMLFAGSIGRFVSAHPTIKMLALAFLVASGWEAGASRKVITPQQAMWMAGYASRTNTSRGKAHDLYAKALALDDTRGTKLVIVTLDLIGEAETAIAENVKAFVGAIARAKPSGVKGNFIKKISISSTMGVGVKLDLSSVSAGGGQPNA